MMRVSPCAWYCFEISDGETWQVEEQRETTRLCAPNGTCVIEIAAARRTSGAAGRSAHGMRDGSRDDSADLPNDRPANPNAGPADEDEIAGIHEKYLKDEGIQPLKTALAENPHQIAAYVTRGLGLDEREHIVCHAWWGNYCAFIKYHGRRESAEPTRIKAFYELVDSLQPLVID